MLTQGQEPKAQPAAKNDAISAKDWISRTGVAAAALRPPITDTMNPAPALIAIESPTLPPMRPRRSAA